MKRCLSSSERGRPGNELRLGGLNLLTELGHQLRSWNPDFDVVPKL